MYYAYPTACVLQRDNNMDVVYVLRQTSININCFNHYQSHIVKGMVIPILFRKICDVNLIRGIQCKPTVVYSFTVNPIHAVEWFKNSYVNKTFSNNKTQLAVIYNVHTVYTVYCICRSNPLKLALTSSYSHDTRSRWASLTPKQDGTTTKFDCINKS